MTRLKMWRNIHGNIAPLWISTKIINLLFNGMSTGKYLQTSLYTLSWLLMLKVAFYLSLRHPYYSILYRALGGCGNGFNWDSSYELNHFNTFWVWALHIDFDLFYLDCACRAVVIDPNEYLMSNGKGTSAYSTNVCITAVYTLLYEEKHLPLWHVHVRVKVLKVGFFLLLLVLLHFRLW